LNRELQKAGKGGAREKKKRFAGETHVSTKTLGRIVRGEKC